MGTKRSRQIPSTPHAMSTTDVNENFELKYLNSKKFYSYYFKIQNLQIFQQQKKEVI